MDFTGEPGLELALAGDPGLELGFTGEPGLELALAGDPGLELGFTGEPGLELALAGDPGFELDLTGDPGFEVDLTGDPGFEGDFTGVPGFEGDFTGDPGLELVSLELMRGVPGLDLGVEGLLPFESFLSAPLEPGLLLGLEIGLTGSGSPATRVLFELQLNSGSRLLGFDRL